MAPVHGMPGAGDARGVEVEERVAAAGVHDGGREAAADHGSSGWLELELIRRHRE
jgi:hypothetical protein